MRTNVCVRSTQTSTLEVLPVEMIGYIITFLRGRETCDNFLTFCNKIFGRDIRSEVASSQIAMAEYGLSDCRAASWPLFVRTAGQKHVAHVKYYQSLGIDVNTQEFIDSLIATQSIDVLDYLRRTNVITNFKKIWAYNHLRILQQNLLESFKFLVAHIDIDRQKVMTNLQYCTCKKMLRWLFNKYNFTMQEIFSDVWFYDNNQVLLRFVAKKFKAHSKDFPQSQLQDAPYPTLTYVYDYLRFPLPSHRNQEIMLYNNFCKGRGQEFFYLMQKFGREEYDHILPERFYNQFLNRCNAKILEFVLEKQECYYTNDENCSCDGTRCFCDGFVTYFEPGELAETMTKKKFRLMYEYDCFIDAWRVYELTHRLGSFANFAVFNILRKYYEKERYIYGFVNGLLMSPLLRENSDRVIQFIIENSLNKKTIKNELPCFFVLKSGTPDLIKFLKIEMYSASAVHAISANNNPVIAMFDKKAIQRAAHRTEGELTIDTFLQFMIVL